MAVQKQVSTPQTVRKTAETLQEQYIDRVVDVPAERESHVMLKTPDHVAQSATVT